MCRPTSEPFEQPASKKHQQNYKAHKRRRVAFHRFASTTVVAPLTNLPDAIQDQIWYRPSDIEEFRTNARELCRELRCRPVSPGESVRGLEFRTDVERQARKDTTIKCILKAQRKCPNPLSLARIYRKCSAWTTATAAVVARSDFFSAYDLDITCDTTVPEMRSYPMPFRPRPEKKRLSTEISSPIKVPRTVRRRTEVIL